MPGNHGEMEQRSVQLLPQKSRENAAGSGSVRKVSTSSDMFELLNDLQSARLNDQRSNMPRGKIFKLINSQMYRASTEYSPGLCVKHVFLSKFVLVKLCGEYLTYADSFTYSLLVLVKFVLNMQGFVVYIQ